MIIAGAGGHAREVFDVLIRSGNRRESIFYFDDVNPQIMNVHKDFIVIKDMETAIKRIPMDPFFCLGVGGVLARKKLFELFTRNGFACHSLKGTSRISEFASLSIGVDVMDNAFIGPDTKIGTGTLVNCSAEIHHDCVVGEFCEISPRSILLGRVSVGAFTQVGAGAIILPDVKIGRNVIIAAGSVVLNDAPENVVLAGVPARIVKDNKNGV